MSGEQIFIDLPSVQGNKLFLKWVSKGPLSEGCYWVEYPDISRIHASAGKLTEASLPLCLTLAALGAEKITLPVEIDSTVLQSWHRIIKIVSQQAFRRNTICVVENGRSAASYRNQPYDNTALFFGGGTESLLALARLRILGISPLILSFGGASWTGSDPEKNPDKFRLDKALCCELGLKRIHAVTNFMQIIKPLRWDLYLRPGYLAMNSFLFSPFFISLALPICEEFGIGHLVQGHERMKDAWEYFCFAPPMTDVLGQAAFSVRYRVDLQSHLKQDICRELYSGHADLTKYQYSCWRNHQERWCHACESCFRYYLFLTVEGLDPKIVGLDRTRLERNITEIIRDTLRSPDCYADEYWGYLWSHKLLRKDTVLRKVLNEIRFKSFFFKPVHDVYMRMPLIPKRRKSRLARPKI